MPLLRVVSSSLPAQCQWAEPFQSPRHFMAHLRQFHNSIKSLHADSQLTSVWLSKPGKPHPPQRCTAHQG